MAKKERNSILTEKQEKELQHMATEMLSLADRLVEEFEEFVDDILQDETLPVNEVKELIKEYGIDIEL